MIIGTTANLTQLPHVLELARSIRVHMPDARFVLCLIERQGPPLGIELPGIDRVVMAEELGIPKLSAYLFKYTAPLIQNALKARFLRYLEGAEAGETRFLFADHRVRFYADVPELAAALDDHPIVLVPHLTESKLSDACARELLVLNNGTFNGSVLGLRKSEEARTFLDWWIDKLDRDACGPCERDFCDQQWLSFAPVFFDVHIMQHPGYLLAFWNFHEASRTVIHVEGERVELSAGTLRCMCFANDDRSIELFASGLQPVAAQWILALKEGYEASVREHAKLGFHAGLYWSYGRYKSGELISREAREAFRSMPAECSPDDPFALGNQRILDLAKEAAAT
ncbi:hypothetical protein [Cohnella fermenti]|uniref:hypothetical protein n=1 Tax=Cohnella fermenti TaxID=2565925 RepID=UPI001454C8FD|nr:hypothetical protein [Cohnella fermenti]